MPDEGEPQPVRRDDLTSGQDRGAGPVAEPDAQADRLIPSFHATGGWPDKRDRDRPQLQPGRPMLRDGQDAGPGITPATLGSSCTAPQLRRFIKSRPYVPMHELRRRFGIDGQEDDVTPVDLGSRRVYVGLPQREGSLLGELLRSGDIGYELSLDPRTPVVVGLYPMRPVART